MEKLADGMLGTNSTEENRSRLKQLAFLDSGWLELAAPSVIGFSANGPRGVRIFSVFPTDDGAERSRANFAEVLPAPDFFTREPMAQGDVKVSRNGRILEFECPNLDFSGRITAPGSFPIFLVPE